MGEPMEVGHYTCQSGQPESSLQRTEKGESICRVETERDRWARVPGWDEGKDAARDRAPAMEQAGTPTMENGAAKVRVALSGSGEHGRRGVDLSVLCCRRERTRKGEGLVTSTHQQTSCGGEEAHRLRELKEELDLQENLFGIDRKIVVLSGKGGVGKSSVAANLAVALSLRGKKTGLLDADVHGPSIPTILGIEGRLPGQRDGKIEPVAYSDMLKVMSVGLLLQDRAEAVVWRGPAKHGVIKQFLSAVAWGELDCLVVDCPPGTGDEPLSVIQLLGSADGAIIVTTPQDVALTDVRKSVTFCRQMNLPLIGVVENMSGFACPHCGEVVNIFKSGGGQQLADEMDVPFLGRLPLDPAMVRACDSGRPFLEEYRDSSAAKPLHEIVGKVLDFNS